MHLTDEVSACRYSNGSTSRWRSSTQVQRLVIPRPPRTSGISVSIGVQGRWPEGVSSMTATTAIASLADHAIPKDLQSDATPVLRLSPALLEKYRVPLFCPLRLQLLPCDQLNFAGHP